MSQNCVGARGRAGRSASGSWLREWRPGVVAGLGGQHMELGRPNWIHPWPGVAASGIEEGRLLGPVERVRQGPVGNGRIPFHRISEIVEIAVAKGGGRNLRVGYPIPSQH